jgi:hypothetical protein
MERIARGPALWIGLALEFCIHRYVCLTGRLISASDTPWLYGPIGTANRVGIGYYEHYAENAGLKIVADDPLAGLLPQFDRLAGPSFDPTRIDPRVKAFYEHTARYSLEAWSNWSWPFGGFAWILIAFISRRMDQMNLPISPLDTSRGMTSEVLKLVGPDGQVDPLAGWFRRMRGSGRAIYAGFYTVATPPKGNGPCVKVIFPVPRGSATVLLRPEAQADGSLKLISEGRRFGWPGFYRVVQTGDNRFRVRHVPAMHEVIHVYVNDNGEMRTDHLFSFFSVPMLRLHYKIALRPTQAAAS